MFIYAIKSEEWVTRIRDHSPSKWIVVVRGAQFQLRDLKSLKLPSEEPRLVVAVAKTLPSLYRRPVMTRWNTQGLFVHGSGGDRPGCADAQRSLNDEWAEESPSSCMDALKKLAVAVTARGHPEFRVPALMQVRQWLSTPNCFSSDMPAELDKAIGTLEKTHRQLLARGVASQVSLQFMRARAAWLEPIRGEKQIEYRNALLDWLRSVEGASTVELVGMDSSALALMQHLSKETEEKATPGVPPAALAFMEACREFLASLMPTGL